MKEIDVNQTAEAIDDMANTMKHYAEELHRHAAKMRERNDISYAGEAMTTVKNCFGNLRIDLLVTRPLREYERIANSD